VDHLWAQDSYSPRYDMAHVNAVSVEQEGGFYLYQQAELTEDEFWDGVMSGKLQPIAGPYASEEEANRKSNLASQIVGEAPIEDYEVFLRGPVRSISFEGVPTQSEGLLIQEENGLMNTSPVETPPPAKEWTEEEKERIWWAWNGKLGLSGDDWVEHLEYSSSLDLPYDATKENRIRVSKLKTEDLIRRMERKDKKPEKVTEWLGEDTYDWYEPEKVEGRYQFPRDLSALEKLTLSARGAGHNFVQGFDNRITMDKFKKKQLPNLWDTVGLLKAIY
jgi:hypothetical protein